MENSKNYTLGALILGASLIICALLGVYAVQQVKKSGQTIRVTGSAVRPIMSDLGILGLNLEVTGKDAEDAFKKLSQQLPLVKAYLSKQGFSSEQIQLSPSYGYPIQEYNERGMLTGRNLYYIYNQRIQVSSEHVLKIKDLSLEAGSLIQQGINLRVDPPQYHSSEIAKVKIEIQAEAAQDAKRRAEHILSATGQKLGPLVDARMGVIQITPRNSNAISDYGMYDLSSIEKEITGVVTVTFLIR